MLVGHKLHTSPLHSQTFICVAATSLRKNRYGDCPFTERLLKTLESYSFGHW